MRLKWLFWALAGIILGASCALAEEATTQKAVPLQNSTEAPAKSTPAPKPKVNVTASVICQKCACFVDTKLLDCSNRNLTIWFNDTEWSILQNGDVLFETIKLNHNLLKAVPQLPTYPVKNLYLAFNNIASLALNAFQNLTELTKLDLAHNKITSKVLLPDVFRSNYKPDAYLPLDKMRELDLGYNDLHNLHADLFEHMPKLEVLLLGGNVFQVIDQLTLTAIAGLASLKTLDLSYMDLKTLPEHLLHGPRELESLILTGNLFQQIPEELGRAMNLKQLVFDENPVKEFGGENVFPEMKSLEYLSISFMEVLTRIENGTFGNLTKLNTLIAASNEKLEFIDERAFSKVASNPEYLDYPPLEKLYLHNNNLSSVNHDWLMRWDKLSVVDLRMNPWVCDCTNSWFIHTLMTQINNTTPLLTKGVECDKPEAWNSVAVMDINGKKKVLVCNSNHPENDSMILLGLFVGILIGVPITFGALLLWRRGCFGLVNRSNRSNQALYNRASFSDDFHI